MTKAKEDFFMYRQHYHEQEQNKMVSEDEALTVNK